MSDTVITALNQALELDPKNETLRYHLMDLLKAAARWSDLLDQAQWFIAQRPDDVRALGDAAHAARELGMAPQAAAYQRMFDLLSQDGTAIPEPKPSVQASPSPDRQSKPVDSGAHIPLGPFANEDQPRPVPSEADEEQTEAPVEPEIKADEDHDVIDGRKVIKLKAVKGGMANDFWAEEEEIITLADVAGMEEVKQRLELSLLGPLKNPEMMKLYGKSLRGGLLLYGPPGCGKTYMARAIAGELGARFLPIGLSDVMDMYVGQSEQNLHQLFESARRNPPTVIFLDEIDALGRKRSLRRESASRDIVNQLLTELDNVKGGNKSLYVLAATNHPWDVDAALRRPGRLDRTLLVLPPDKAARQFLLEREFKDRPTEKLDIAAMAQKTEHFSGADLVHLCESAAEIAMADSMKRGTVRPIQQKDCKRALKDIRPSTRTWFETARNYALFSNDGGAYDDLLAYMRDRRLL